MKGEEPWALPACANRMRPYIEAEAAVDFRTCDWRGAADGVPEELGVFFQGDCNGKKVVSHKMNRHRY